MSFLRSLLSPGELARSPGQWLLDGESKSATIRPQDSLTLSAVFACVRSISEDVAKMPLKAYRELPDGGKTPAKSDPMWPTPRNTQVNLYKLVHDDPNEMMTSMDMRQAIMVGACLWGNGFAEITRDGGARPIAITPVEPWRVAVKKTDAGKIYYEIDGGESPDIEPRNMIHVKGISSGGIVGYMLAALAQQGFAVYKSAEEFTGAFFANNASLAGVITFENRFQKAEDLQEYRRKFNETYTGSRKSNQWMIADNGAKVNPISSDPEKAQLINTLEFRIEDVARWFRVPPHKIQHLARATFSNIEHQGMEYLQDTLTPWLVRMQQEFTRKLVTDDDVTIEHVMNFILWADASGRSNFYNAGIRGGWLTPNEARSLENMNPYEGGDMFRVEQNLALIGDDGVATPTNGAVAMMPAFVSACERCIDREVKAYTGAKSPDAAWLAKFYSGHQAYIAESLRPLCDTAARLGGAAFDADAYAAAWCAESVTRIEHGEDPQTWRVDRPATMAEEITTQLFGDK